MQWQVNGKVLEPSERVDLQTYGSHTTLDIPFSLRSDSGPYRLTLSNELGSDSAQATVTVLGENTAHTAGWHCGTQAGTQWESQLDV